MYLRKEKTNREEMIFQKKYIIFLEKNKNRSGLCYNISYKRSVGDEAYGKRKKRA